MARSILATLADPVAATLLYSPDDTPGTEKQADVVVALSNRSGTTRAATVYAVPAGDAPGTDNQLFSAMPIPPNENAQIGVVLGPGDEIHVGADAAGFSVVAFGDESPADV